MQRLKQNVQEMLDISLSSEQLEAFEIFSRELALWNQRISLTTISDPDEVRNKHFQDSLSCWLALRGTRVDRVIDVGSGAGFPGLPLKILHPHTHLTLVESVGKKAAFLEHMVQVLGLSGVEVLNERVEDIGQEKEHRELYDWALARALAPMPTLAEYLFPLVRLGGFVLAQKGPAAPMELENAENSISILGGGNPQLIKVNLPNIDETRYLVISEKIKSTPEKYPRRVGMPAKRPL